jgi:hypothetical protein
VSWGEGDEGREGGLKGVVVDNDLDRMYVFGRSPFAGGVFGVKKPEMGA